MVGYLDLRLYNVYNSRMEENKYISVSHYWSSISKVVLVDVVGLLYKQRTGLH